MVSQLNTKPATYRYLRDGGRFDPNRLQPLAEGGEATIYRISGQPNFLVKLYNEVNPMRSAKVRMMLRKAPIQDPSKPFLAWPVDAIVSGRKGDVIGCVIPNGRMTLTLLDVFTPKLRQKLCPNIDAKFLARVAYNLCVAFSRAHAYGLFIGDVNEQNVLVRQDSTVMLIDADSFQIKEGNLVYPCVVGRPEYTPPELVGKSFARAKRSIEHDLFGLSVLVFQLFMNGRHPFDGVDDVPTVEERIRLGRFPHSFPRIPGTMPPPDTRLSALPGPLVKLFNQAFVDGHSSPRNRPSAETWASALRSTETLTACLRLR